jgi:hypothetical protein
MPQKESPSKKCENKKRYIRCQKWSIPLDSKDRGDRDRADIPRCGALPPLGNPSFNRQRCTNPSMKEPYNPSPINIPKGTTFKRQYSTHRLKEIHPVIPHLMDVIQAFLRLEMRLFTHLLQQELYNTIVLHPFMLGEVVVKQFFTTIFLFDISQEEQPSVYKV